MTGSVWKAATTEKGPNNIRHISKRSLYMYANVDHTCDPQLCQVNARACKHTTTMVTPLQTNKIHVMQCNPLKDRQTECNYTAIKSRFIYATTRNVD